MFRYKSCRRCEISPLALELIKFLSVRKYLPFLAYKFLVNLMCG